MYVAYQIVFLGKTYFSHNASLYLCGIKVRGKISSYVGTSILFGRGDAT